ncbi:MAG: putative ABC transporter permease [Lawsonibacter sp.]|nr:putative ABC transporter permease [Lawsonibacter sp.]
MSWLDLALYLLIYSFLGWCTEVLYYAVTQRQFRNRGFLTLPFLLSYGVSFDLMMLTLPALAGRYWLQFLLTMAIVSVVESFSEHLNRWLGPNVHWGGERPRILAGSWKGLISSGLVSAGFYVTYLVSHPLLLGVMTLVPALLKTTLVCILALLIAADFVGVLYTLRTGGVQAYERREASSSEGRIAGRLTANLWRRLQKAYPGIREMTPEEQGVYTFARGVCLDKLVWVFLSSALLGDIIETFWCGLVNGQWMSRSSVLYGPFSFVWGLGAVVLTVTLQRLAERDSFFAFAAGFFIGGTYEYMCSVFTELVFGTVFWDYSHMPLNIGGRTNVLFCFFWGVLAVFWIKGIYPRMSRLIEGFPALAGKIMTWVVVALMVCNGLLTCAAMLRYNTRAVRPQPANSFEEFIDRQYGDGFMEHRWPNMIVTT